MIRALIRLYRFFLSPIMGNQCRYHPTCSHYAEEAYEKHGFFKGTILTTYRILRCNPWCRGEALDEVPKRFAYRDMFGYKKPSHSKRLKDK